MSDFITVDYKVYSTTISALQALDNLPYTLALDLETQSLYSNEERAEAKQLLKEGNLDRPTERLCKLVANSSGLSYPSITKITHLNIAWSESEALVVVISSLQMEIAILKWIVESKHHFLVWNSLFDLKQVYVKTGQLPSSYDDPMLLAKSYLNHADTWKANVGLKFLLGPYYKPSWSLAKEDYDNEDLKKESFLAYCATDACAVIKGWEILDEMKEEKEEED